jgi:aminopeptidase N
MCLRCDRDHVLDSASSDVRDMGARGPRPFALPGAEPRYARDRTIKVRHMRIEVALDFEKKRIDGAVTHTFSALNDGLARVVFDAVELEIKAAAVATPDGPGEALAFSADGERVAIELPRALAAGEEISVRIAYGGAPRRGLYFVGPDADYPEKPRQAWTQGQDEDSRYWFPCYDYPNEKATSEVIATVPESMFALSNGRLVGVERDERRGTKTYAWSFGTPHVAYLVTLAAGEFDADEVDVDGIPVQYYVPRGRFQDIPRAFARTPAMIRHFSEVTGVKYPYEKYAQVCVADFIFGGMENTSATTLTDAALHDERSHEDQRNDALIAHELAHQWFGDLITCKDWSQGWLNEGFATYFENVWREKDEGWDAARYNFSQEAEAYFAEDAGSYRRPIVTRVYKDAIEVFDRHLYEKGGLVLDMLRNELGDALFWKGIRHYTRSNAGRNVVTADLAQAFEEATGRNIEWFLDQWVFRGGHPELDVSYEWDEDEKIAKVTVKQKQKLDEVTPLFRATITVGFRLPDGGAYEERVELKPEKEQAFHFRLAAKPVSVRFDPGDRLLKKLTMKLGDDMLKALLGDEDAMLRIRAAKALGEKASPAAVAALRARLLEEKEWFVAGEIAKALGEVRGEAARDALIEALAVVKHPKARRGVVEALGEFREDEKAAAALIEVAAGDVSYVVEGEAAKSLGKTRSPRAFETIVRVLERKSQNDVIQQKALEGLQELRDERGIEVCERFAAYGAPALSRGQAIMALGRLGKEFPDRREHVRDVLERLLDDPWFRAQVAAPKALETLGDPAAIGALERARARALDGRVRRRAADAIRKLEKGKSREEEVKHLRDDVDKLKDENRALRDRIEKLEKLLAKA